jgi:hypothetical protein
MTKSSGIAAPKRSIFYFMDDKWIYGRWCNDDCQGNRDELGEKSAPLPHCPQQTQNGFFFPSQTHILSISFFLIIVTSVHDESYLIGKRWVA